jgi:hypothetical protein
LKCFKKISSKTLELEYSLENVFTTVIFSGNTYAPLTNSPLTSAIVNAQTSGGGTSQQQHGLQTSPVNSHGQQFVSYNGETYLIQSNPNGTHQLIANLNGTRSMSPPQGGGLAHLDKQFSPENSSSESNVPQIGKLPSEHYYLSHATFHW